MNFKNQKFLSAAALFLIFAVSQVYIGVSFAEPNGGVTPSAAPQQLMGILTTRNDQPILVNGVSAISGATIPSGATIQTPEGVGATINIGALGSICIAPNTRIAVDFAQSGNGGNINVSLAQGCAILTTEQKRQRHNEHAAGGWDRHRPEDGRHHRRLPSARRGRES